MGDHARSNGATPKVTVEEVNRLLEVGRLLRSVLTEEELSELAALLNGEYSKLHPERSRVP